MTVLEAPAAPPARVHFAPRMTLAEKITYAEELRRASLLARPFGGSRANVLFAVEYAEASGLHPLTVMQGLAVIRGKAAANAGLITALVRMAGHTVRVHYDDERHEATCTITRADDPEPYVCPWTAEKALTAGLIDSVDEETGKVTARDKDKQPTAWEKYTPALLKARALTECARQACQEALFGICYTPEELGAVIDEDGNAIGEPEQIVPAAAPARSAFHPQNGAALAYAGATVEHASNVVQYADAAGQLGATITAKDTGLPEKLHAFLLRIAATNAKDANTVIGIFRAAEAAGIIDDHIPGPAASPYIEGADTQTMREYLTAAGLSLRASRTVPLPLAVQAVVAAQAAAQAAEEAEQEAAAHAAEQAEQQAADEGEDDEAGECAGYAPHSVSDAIGASGAILDAPLPGPRITESELYAALGSGHPEVEASATEAYYDTYAEAEDDVHPGADKAHRPHN